MRVLLDESIPIDFARDLAALDAQTVISAHAIGVVLIRAHSNRIDELRPLVSQILAAVAASEPGEIRIVGA